MKRNGRKQKSHLIFRSVKEHREACVGWFSFKHQLDKGRSRHSDLSECCAVARCRKFSLVPCMYRELVTRHTSQRSRCKDNLQVLRAYSTMHMHCAQNAPHLTQKSYISISIKLQLKIKSTVKYFTPIQKKRCIKHSATVTYLNFCMYSSACKCLFEHKGILQV